MKKSSRAPQRLATVIIGIGWLWIALLIVWGDRLRYSGYVHAGGLWWAILAFAAFAVLTLKHAFARAFLGVVLGLLILSYDGWLMPDLSARPPGAVQGRFRLVTASLRTLNGDMAAAATSLSRYRPDVMVVQEIETGDREKFLKVFRLKNAGTWYAAHLDTKLILSRWKPSEVGGLRGILRVSLDAPFGSFWLWNVHAPKDYGGLAEIDRYFDILAADLDSRKTGIVAGDFNATPWNDSYRGIAKVLDDSFRGAAWGGGLSFPSRARRLGVFGPLARIDHVFATSEFVPSNAFVGGPISGSDHFPLIVDFAYVR